jgi:hypothetical protein
MASGNSATAVQMNTRHFSWIMLSIVSVYVFGMSYFVLHLNLSGMDALYMITAALTLSGKYYAPSDKLQSLVGLVCVIIGVIPLYLLCRFIANDIKDATDNANKYIINGDVTMKSTIRNAYLHRLVFPIMHYVCVLSVGSVLFSANEGWSMKDALYYCLVFKTAGAANGNSIVNICHRASPRANFHCDFLHIRWSASGNVWVKVIPACFHVGIIHLSHGDRQWNLRPSRGIIESCRFPLQPFDKQKLKVCYMQ